MIANEDDFDNFETWLARSQGIDLAALSTDEVAMWRGYYDEARQRSLATPKVGLMNLQPIPGEHRYAVAVREDGDLWLTLWVKRSPGPIFCDGATRRSRLGPSHKLSLRRLGALEELPPQISLAAKATAVVGVFEEQSIWAPMEGTAQSALEQFAIRPLFLGWSSFAWCFGARWNSFSRPYRTRLRTDFLACSDCSTRSLS